MTGYIIIGKSERGGDLLIFVTQKETQSGFIYQIRSDKKKFYHLGKHFESATKYLEYNQSLKKHLQNGGKIIIPKD